MSSGPVRAGIENINSTMKANLVILLAATTAVVMVAVLQRPEPGGNPTPSAVSSAPRAGSAAGPLPVVAATAAVVVPSPGTNSLPPGLAGFAAWTGGFLAESNPALRAAALAQGETLALARREEMARLIQSDPKRALELAVPMAVRGQLPPEITRHLEERLSGRGSLGVLVADNFETSQRQTLREVHLAGQRYDAFVYGRRLDQVTRDKVPLHGIAIDDRMAVHEDAVRPLEIGEPVPQAEGAKICPVSGRAAEGLGQVAAAQVAGRVEYFCGASHINTLNQRLAADEGGEGGGGEGPFAEDAWSQGPKSVLYMRLNFPDDLTEPITESAAYALMDGVNTWYVEDSYGTTALIPTITPLLTLPQTKAYYSLLGYNPGSGTSTLLNDARAVARAAGYDTDNYNLDIVRFNSVPGFSFGGLASVRGKGCWMQSSSSGVTIHELGHNYGLWHGNYWNAAFDSVIGPGSHVEYGDSFDTMGAASGGNNQFSAPHKSRLDWMPDSFVQQVTNSGIYRIHTFDVPVMISGQAYAFKVRKNYDRDYWGEFRTKFTSYRWFQNGVMLHWDPWALSASGTHLLDTTPGSADGKNDSPVILGRTFTDPGAGVHITTVAKGGFAPNTWLEVAVNLGAFPGNTAPLASLHADDTSVAVNSPVNLFVTATDADALAYYWEFGDATVGANSPAAVKTWSTAGDYLVRCEVSDMKGGKAGVSRVIRVGNPGTYRISGRVTAALGEPVAGVRFHNGQSGTSYRGAFTDSDGSYTIAGLAAGDHSVLASLYGFNLSPAGGWPNPVSVGPDATGKDFTATPAPAVNIALTSAPATEAGPTNGMFTIYRTGSTNGPLVVKLNRTGTAAYSSDYTAVPALTGTSNALTIPAGAASLDIVIQPINDAASEGPETVILSLMEDAAYVFAPLAEAILRIEDNEVTTLPAVSVAASSSTGPEYDNLAPESGSDSGVFRFTRSGNASGELTIYYTVSGTASAGVDFAGLSGVVTIPEGQTFSTAAFTAIDDVEVEGSETVVVTLLANPAYTGSGNATVTIMDDDPTVVTVLPTDTVASEEGSGTGRFTITRVGGLAANLVVGYVMGGMAINGVDYTLLPGTVTILAGQSTATVTFTPINDALVEGDETVSLILSNSPVCNPGNPGSATIILADNEIPTVTLTVADAIATEPTSDTGRFTVSRGSANSGNLTVYFAVSGKAIPGADYLNIGTSVVIPDGANSANVTITPIDDLIREADENVTLLLVNGPAYNVLTNLPATVTLRDDDPSRLPAVGFTVATNSQRESVTTARIFFSLSASSTSNVTVDYFVTGGTATGGGVDYTLASGLLTILPGHTSTNRTFTVVNDTNSEPDETMVISLGNFTNAVPDAITNLTYTILDDDSASVSISVVDATASETGPDTGAFRVTRAGDNSAALLVPFELTGSAGSAADYLPVGYAVTIPAGAAFVDLIITPVDDPTPEGNEVVTVTLFAPTPGKLSSPKTASLTITDNDSTTNLPIVTISATDAISAEPGTNTALYTVTRDRGTNTALVVNYTVGGSAASGSDFNSIGTAVTIPAGAYSASIVLTARDDSTYEGDETVVVTLTVQSAYRVGTPAAATLVIQDNEAGVSLTAVAHANEEGARPGSFLVSRTGSTAANLTVNFSLAGTTTSGADFAAVGTSLLIPSGAASANLLITPVDDALFEGNESVVATLAAGTGYTVIAPSNAFLLILDSEPTVSVTAVVPTALEGSAQTGRFQFTRTGGTNSSLVVGFTVGGTTQAGVDFTSLPPSVVFPAGVTTVQVTVSPLDDLLAEPDESVVVTLNSGGAYAPVLPTNATVLILDNEPSLTISTDTLLVSEDSGDPGRIEIVRSGATNLPLTVLLNIGGAATPGVDYQIITGSVSFLPGEQGALVPVMPIDDPNLEGDETVVVTLVSNAAYHLNGPRSATVTIADDEANTPPVVSILCPTSEVVFLPATNLLLVLEAEVVDDGRPLLPGAVTVTWSKAAGPGAVVFENANSLRTVARFGTPGVYTLRVTADDSEYQRTDEITVVTAPLTSLATGLQGHWRLNETNGATGMDVSTNGRNATVSGAVWTAAGRFQGALDFDGVNDLATFNAPGLTAGSLSLWFRNETAGASLQPHLVSLPGMNLGISRSAANLNAIFFESVRGTANGQWQTAPGLIIDSNWHHLVVTYDGAGTTNVPAIYLDGVSRPVVTTAAPSGIVVTLPGTSALGNRLAQDRSFDGRLDEVRLYDRLLGAEEIPLLAAGPPANFAPQPDAGEDITSTLQNILMTGTVTDDGLPLPPAVTTVKWTIVSGPGPAFILSDISLVTPVIFPTLGLYVLRLTANDGQVKTASDVLVNVVANPNISIEATIPTGMEFGPVEAEFSFYHDGATNLSLTVPFLISGSASNGVDYVALSNSVVIPAGASFITLCIVPLLDTLAEGDETVTLTLSLTQGPVGGPGTNTRATIVIRDRPWDDWRMTHFTMSELTNLTISGESGDVDQDGLFNLWEFSQNRLPRVADASSGFTASIEPWPATGQNHLVTSCKRRLPPNDLLYEVEVSTNLVHWTSGPAVTAEIFPVIQDGNGLTETARVRVLAPVSQGGARFVRLKVSLR